MDRDDQVLVDRTKAYFNVHFPVSVLARLEQLPGEYRAAAPPQRMRASPARGFPHPTLHLRIAYRVNVRQGFYVRFHVELEEPTRDVWRVAAYSYHFGTNQFAGDDRDPDTRNGTHLRICRPRGCDQQPPTAPLWQRHHFHRRSYETAFERGHIPPSHARPSLEDGADWFVGVIEHYVEHDVILVEVTP